MHTPATPTLHHLFALPQHRGAVARLIHDEFWTQVPGASADAMAARLAQADRADRVPLCRVALLGGVPVGAVNLVASDSDDHPDWTPWLAGVVVAAPWRGQSIGTLLVRQLLADAQGLGLARLYFGTSSPAFYSRLGAVLHQPVRADFSCMRFDLAAAAG